MDFNSIDWDYHIDVMTKYGNGDMLDGMEKFRDKNALSWKFLTDEEREIKKSYRLVLKGMSKLLEPSE